ncbi:MAG: SPOR domain-containing protein [Deltaproteobacteria bacterium]|nr:SPOR domain-containing protein [Deltaproteobacteria bacterium]
MPKKSKSSSAGLSIGAVLVLTLGFLVASLLIFVFGIWVGKDLVERRLAQEERVVRKPAERMLPERQAGEIEATAPAPPKAAVPAAAATAVTSAPAVVAVPTTVALRAAAIATPTLERATATVTAKAAAVATAAVTRPTPSPTPARAGRAEEWADAGWTVQVYATTDPNQATALARRLLAKGYDAYTLQAPMRGQTWYRVRVGRFTSHDKAKEMEQRLKKLENLEAAYVTAQ